VTLRRATSTFIAMTMARKILDLPSLFGPTSVVSREIGIFRAAVMLRKFSTVTETSFTVRPPSVWAMEI
jgi:hypothetical protein